MSRAILTISTLVILGSLCGCVLPHKQANAIEFTRVPRADTGGPIKLGVIEGRVTGARPGQQIVLYARSGQWFVQPYVDQPFTTIQGSSWKNTIHLGTEYAALLVQPGYRPTVQADMLPTQAAPWWRS